jgi:hypothetical protein
LKSLGATKQPLTAGQKSVTHSPNLFVGYRLNFGYGYRDRLADITREQRSAFRYVADRKNANTVRRDLDPRVNVMGWRILA